MLRAGTALGRGGGRQPPQGRIASSLDLNPYLPFQERADLLRPGREPHTIRNQLRLLWRIVRSGLRGRPLVLYSSRGSLKPDLIACVLLGLLPRRRRPPTVLVGEMWQPGSGLRTLGEKLVVRLADRVIDRYLVLSQAEADLLPQSWPVSAGKTRVCPFYFRPSEHGLDDTAVPARGPLVFAGGDSFRDYGPVVEAARRLPDVPFLLVTKSLPPHTRLPANVTVAQAGYSEYVSLMSEAGIVLVPVRVGLRRSAGILTFLMAMYLGKPTIVTRALAVDEYVEDGRTGMLVDGSPEQWVEAIMSLRGDDARSAALGQAAGRVVRERYAFERYAECILRHLDEVSAAPRSVVR